MTDTRMQINIGPIEGFEVPDLSYTTYIINTIKGIITAIAFLPIPLIVVFIFSSYLFTGNDLFDDEEDEEVQQIPYEKRYPINDILDPIYPNSNDTPKDEIIRERHDGKLKLYATDYTPNGNVIMRYNHDVEGFEYWCDDKNIKYDYLETVARKYVKSFNCKDVYIDRDKNIEQQLNEIKKKEAEEKEKAEAETNAEEESQDTKSKKEEETDDDLFVKLKTPLEKSKDKYKAKMELRNRKTGKTTTQEEITKETIVPTKANKYVRKGDFKEAQLFQKEKKVEHKKVSFSMFKSMFGGGNSNTTGATSPMS